MKNVKLQKKSISEVVEILNNGGVAVCPTDTVYGFLADATNKKAVEKIFKIKKRPRSKPLAVFVKDIKNVKGTRVSFFIKIKSKRDLAKVFREFSGDSFEFGKTRVIVTLYKMGESYISRSQARRVLSGLDKFHEIILNFNGVETVGQAFTDEVFRVWQAHHPRIKIKYENANDNIVFMIKRATKQAP